MKDNLKLLILSYNLGVTDYTIKVRPKLDKVGLKQVGYDKFEGEFKIDKGEFGDIQQVKRTKDDVLLHVRFLFKKETLEDEKNTFFVWAWYSINELILLEEELLSAHMKVLKEYEEFISYYETMKEE